MKWSGLPGVPPGHSSSPSIRRALRSHDEFCELGRRVRYAGRVKLRLVLVAMAAVASLAVVACGGGSSSGTSGSPLPGASIRPAAKGAGSLLIAGPDGIAEFDLASKTSKPLIKPQQDNTYLLDPDVSPDGTRIAYIVEPPPKIQGKTYDAGSDLWVANRDGSGQHAIYTHDTPNQLVRFPQWEDAGHILAVVQEISETSGATNVTYMLERIDVATGQRTHLLENVLSFGLSPDHKQLAYAKLLAQTGESLETMPLTSAVVGAAGKVIVGTDQNLLPFNSIRYSPDGTKIAFTSADQTGARADERYVTARAFGASPDGLPEDVWTVDAAGGGEAQRVANVKEDLPWLAWNGDGTHIYVVGAAALYDVNLKSGAVDHIGPGAFHGQVTWTP